MKKILHPQEIETYYIIPTIRRYFATFLKESGMKQKVVANLLGISSSSISQYTKSKRGHKIQFSPEIIQEIRDSSIKINDNITYFQQMQHIILTLRKTNVLCQIHRQFSDLPETCRPELVGCHVQYKPGVSNN
jgi:predicted transcriptional regulator